MKNPSRWRLFLLMLALVVVPPRLSAFRDYCFPARGGARPDDHAEESVWGALVRQSSRALAATARGSTRVAADLVRPKEVAWDELVGWWHLDVALDDDADEPFLTVEITPHGRARWTTADGVTHEYTVEFRPAAWPRSARLKFGSKHFYYQCTVQRKLANLDILKLRGKIYAVRRFQGKVQVGSFVGRRRVVVMKEELEDEYDDDESEEVEETDTNDAVSAAQEASDNDHQSEEDEANQEEYSEWDEEG